MKLKTLEASLFCAFLTSRSNDGETFQRRPCSVMTLTVFLL
jgi:hypothetical protein